MGSKHWPMHMNALGYDTHLFGFQHEAIDPKDLGYRHTEYGFPNATISAMDVAPRVQQFLEGYRDEDGHILHGCRVHRGALHDAARRAGRIGATTCRCRVSNRSMSIV